MQVNRQLLRSGGLASRAGASTGTLRYYEQRGVLSPPPRLSNGYRCYPAESLERMQVVRSALRIGFSTDELSRVLRIRQSSGVPCRGGRCTILMDETAGVCHKQACPAAKAGYVISRSPGQITGYL